MNTIKYQPISQYCANLEHMKKIDPFFTRNQSNKDKYLFLFSIIIQPRIQDKQIANGKPLGATVA